MQDFAAPALVRRPDEDVRRAALEDDPPDSRNELVRFLLQEVGAEDDGQAAKRGDE